MTQTAKLTKHINSLGWYDLHKIQSERDNRQFETTVGDLPQDVHQAVMENLDADNWSVRRYWSV